jgi:hypothetical protein
MIAYMHDLAADRRRQTAVKTKDEEKTKEKMQMNRSEELRC